jgi:hypothetical protein
VLVRIDIATRAPRVDDDHGDSVLVGKSVDAMDIDLPVFLGEKIVVSSFHAVENSTGLVEQVARPWKQDVGTGTS